MLREDFLREIAARRERGESTRCIARELGVDCKHFRRRLRIGGWRPRQNGNAVARSIGSSPSLIGVGRRWAGMA